MSYIGVQPTAGQYRKLDDISASFNGSTTSFTTSVGGTNVTAGTAQQLLVSVGGVIQEPDADYTVSTNTITFTTAPATGLDFFAVLMGDALNTVSTSDGSITTAKLAGSLSVGLAAGTNSAPSLYFTGDSNTGVYSPGADQVAVTTGGTARLTIDSSGNVNIDSNTLYVDAANNRVGLGTSSPSYLLDCKSTGATNVARFLTGATTSSEVAQFGRSDQAVNLSIDYDGAGSMGIGTTTAHPFNLKTGAVTRATIDTSGRLGIGTTSPARQLDVNSTAIFDSNGNGSTTSPSIAIGSTGTGLSYIGSQQLAFLTNSAERARIDSSGRLLVNTSSASSSSINDLKTVIAGNVKLGSNLTAGRTGGDYDGLGYNVAWQASSGYKYEVSDYAAYIKYGVNGRIETFTAPSGTGGNGITFTAGPYVAQGGTSWTSSSDERLKEDLLPIKDALNKTNALRAVTGKFKTDPVEKRRAFLIAQDVQTVLPEAVDSTNSESLGLDYSAIIPLLVAALKESKERIETLEAKVAALDAL